jgi:hypothetical protein
MMNPDGFDDMVLALMQRGYTRDQAEDYTSRIGDTPELNQAGQWVIRDDNGTVIDTIKPIEDE